MLKPECVGPDALRLEISSNGPPHIDLQVYITPDEARRFAAELLVAADRAERLESDQRAPG